MNLWKVGACCLMAGGLYACTGNTDGTLLTPDPVAGFRYVNLVSDTGAMDFRIIDVIQNAPNQTAAAFRTGGQMSGVASGNLPQHQAVLADGTPRHIRVFMNGSTAAVASQIMFDTTFTFTAGAKYTMYLYGSARTPPLSAAIIQDTLISTPANGKISVRVLNLAPDLTGNPGGVAAAAGYFVDGRVGLSTSAVPIPGTAAFPNVGYKGITPYVALDTTPAAGSYRIAFSLAGAATPVAFQAQLPAGTRGNATANPLAGAAVVGSAITAVIVPRSTPGTQATQGAPAAVSTAIDSVLRSNDTVTVVRSIGAATATACGAPAAAGAAAGDIVNVSGLTQPEYNGSQVAIVAVAGTAATNFPTCTTPTPVRSRFRYRISGAPVSPATGTPSFRVVTAGNDFTAPYAIFMVDQNPPRTAP
jgi:hypothetical protein